MAKNDNCYCALERFSSPDCWNSITEIYNDYPSIINRMQEIFGAHQQESDVGVSVILHNRWGAQLHVGMSRDGWLLIMQNPGQPSCIIRGNNRSGDGYTVFLLPERTDFERELLLSQDTAESTIRSWLDTGIVEKQWEVKGANSQESEVPEDPSSPTTP